MFKCVTKLSFLYIVTPKYLIEGDQLIVVSLNLILFELCDDLRENKIVFVFDGLIVIFQSVDQGIWS